ncbi:MAG: FAD/NAD(P)-binding oxidoreductase [Sulfurospirillaceae bacterium]|nr:FAD/NAD(P)-binding oxidoreductase [Sulfurospirillaceae bacterium]
MDSTNIDEMCDALDVELKKRGLSRRDALKLAGLGTASFMLNPTIATAATKAEASNAKAKIVIAGGGAAGCSVASYLAKNLSSPDITIIEPNPKGVSYQPGQTLIASGVWTLDDILADNKDFYPSEAKWIQDSITEFDPDNNKVKTAKSGDVTYDFLVVATGLQLNYDAIEGLTKEMIGKDGIGSIYFAEGAVKTWPLMQEFVQKAKKGGKKVEGVFTHPATPIKCGGAPKKIMYLTHARLEEAGARANAELTFYPSGGSMFGVKEYHEAIVKQFESRNMKWKYKHNLVGVDAGKKIAIFDNHYLEKGKWDEDLGEFEMIPKIKKVEVPYDFLHVTPPMSAPKVVKDSPLSWKKGSAAAGGWVELEKETLHHTRYKNVFALGDVAGIPMGKTGGSVRKQYGVLCQNLIAMMEGKQMSAKYDGYTVCPLITGLNTVALLEFNWTNRPAPSFPLDPSQERWIWWLLKVYALKPMYFYGMLKGRA